MPNPFGVFKKIAPWIVTAVTTGPVGIAAMALKKIGEISGKGTPATAEEALEHLQGLTAEQLGALKAEDHDFAVRMRELDIQAVTDLERIAADDRSDARQREVRTGDSWTPRLIAGIFIVGWFSIQWYLLSHVVPTEMREIIMRTLGTLDMGLGLILGYYFGSSAGGRLKDETINKLST